MIRARFIGHDGVSFFSAVWKELPAMWLMAEKRKATWPDGTFAYDYISLSTILRYRLEWLHVPNGPMTCEKYVYYRERQRLDPTYVYDGVHR